MAWWRRSWLPLVLGLLGAGGIGLVMTGVKLVAGRSRPPLPFAAVAEDGYSFPSGHATGIMVVVLLSAWMLARWVIRPWNGRVLVWTAAALATGPGGLAGGPMPEQALDGHPAAASRWQAHAWSRPGPGRR